MGSPKFDPTINLGHILTVVTLMLGGFTAWSSVNAALTNHELRLNMHDDILTRGREERLAYQRQAQDAQDKILEQLAQIREDIAALRATQAARPAR